MKIQGVVCLALAGALSGCIQVISKLSAEDGPMASGPTSTRTYDVRPFSRIEAGSIFEIEYSAGSKTHVEIEAQQTAFEHIDVKCENGQLQLKLRDNLRVENPIKVKLTSPSLDGIDLSGASTGNFAGISSRRFEVGLSGGASATVNGKAGEIHVDLSGSSDLETSTHGQFSLTGSVSGNGSLKANGEASRLDIEASGNSKVELERIAGREAKVDVSGSSTINTKGSVDTLDVTASGASACDLQGLRVGKATVSAGGASRVSVGDTHTLTADASGGSTVNFKGHPTISQSVSGGASVSAG